MDIIETGLSNILNFGKVLVVMTLILESGTDFSRVSENVKTDLPSSV